MRRFCAVLKDLVTQDALTALGFNPAVRSRSAPMLVKDEIRPISNLPPDGNSTPNAALQDILPFDEHIGFE